LLTSTKKNVVAGLGEIGKPIMKLLEKKTETIGYDINPNLMNLKKFEKYKEIQTSFLHVCTPYNSQFIENVLLLSRRFKPKIIVIHSTISPYTTRKIQSKLLLPVIYSPTRGVHKRMMYDLKRYEKFFALDKKTPKAKWAIAEYSKLMKLCGIKTKNMSNPLTLELAKIIVDTSYYGWLINYSQLSNIIAKKFNVDYDEMWSFSDEIHKFLGNRPKMFPGFIGGHCVIPNLTLIEDKNLNIINEINKTYLKKVKNAKSLSKKYVKGKQSFDLE